jgi:internalin A
MKNRKILVFLSVSLLVVLSFVIFIIVKDHSANQSPQEEPLVFTDKVFESSLKKALNKDDKDKIYQSELNDYVGIVIAADHMYLVSPTVTEKNVVLYSGEKFQIDTTMYTQAGTMTSLDDLKYFSNLTSLKVYFQKHIDYNTISTYSGINNLSLYADDLVDLTFVGRFINLAYVSLSYNKVENLSPLSDLSKLKTAIINYNNISNISGIEKCTSLTNLQLDNNKISDISLISSLTNLTYLSLQKNNITDVSPMQKLTNLQNLFVKDNPVINMDSLNTLTIIPE